MSLAISASRLSCMSVNSASAGVLRRINIKKINKFQIINNTLEKTTTSRVWARVAVVPSFVCAGFL